MAVIAIAKTGSPLGLFAHSNMKPLVAGDGKGLSRSAISRAIPVVRALHELDRLCAIRRRPTHRGRLLSHMTVPLSRACHCRPSRPPTYSHQFVLKSCLLDVVAMPTCRSASERDRTLRRSCTLTCCSTYDVSGGHYIRRCEEREESRKEVVCRQSLDVFPAHGAFDSRCGSFTRCLW